MKTIAQQLGVTDFPFEIKDKNSHLIYCEYSDNTWWRRKYDSDGRVIYFETSNGYWEKWQYDSDGRVIYYEDSDGLVQGISITQSQSQEGRKVKKTIAQQLNIKDFPFIIKDDNGKEIYSEDYTGYWKKCEYDSDGKEIYYETSNGYWEKYEYDSDGNRIYYETSNGVIKDNRPKDEIIVDGIKYKRMEQ